MIENHVDSIKQSNIYNCESNLEQFITCSLINSLQRKIIKYFLEIYEFLLITLKNNNFENFLV